MFLRLKRCYAYRLIDPLAGLSHACTLFIKTQPTAPLHVNKGTSSLSGQQANREFEGLLLSHKGLPGSCLQESFLVKKELPSFRCGIGSLFPFVGEKSCRNYFAEATAPRLCLKRSILRCPQELFFAALQLSVRRRYAFSYAISRYQRAMLLLFFPLNTKQERMLVWSQQWQSRLRAQNTRASNSSAACDLITCPSRDHLHNVTSSNQRRCSGCDSSQDTKLNTKAPPETNSTTNTLEHWSFKNAVVSLNFASTEATFRDSTALDSPGISKALYCP